MLGDPGQEPASARPEPAQNGDEQPEGLPAEETAVGDDGPTWGARLSGVVRGHKRLSEVAATCLLILGALTGLRDERRQLIARLSRLKHWNEYW